MQHNKIIEIKNMSKEFLSKKKEPILACNDICLDIYENEFLSIVGESGSGKSTLLRLITQLETKTKGQVFYNNCDITELKKEELRQHRKNIQMVFQDTSSTLNPKMKIIDAICEPLINFNLINKNDKEKVAEDFLKKVELDSSYLYKKPSELSGGQRQRVCLARALTLQPKVLLLDEPTSALDVITQAKIIKLIKKMQEENNLTIVLVCHDLALVSAISDRIAVMHKGELVEIMQRKALLNQKHKPYTEKLIESIFDIKKCSCNAHKEKPFQYAGQHSFENPHICNADEEER